MKNRYVFRLVCFCLALLMIPLAAFPAMAEEPESYNFAKGQIIEADNNYFPPEGFFDASFLVDGEWLTLEGDNLKLGWNTDPFSGIGETDPVTITVSLDTYYLLEKIVLYPMKWTNGEAFPRDFELLGSVDGSEWFEVYAPQQDVTAAAEDNVSVVPKEYALDTPVSIRYFRIRITRHSPVFDATGAASSALGEIELYGYQDTAAEEEAARALSEAKANAADGLKVYRESKDNKAYREAQIAELDAALTKGLEAIEGAQDTDAVTAATEFAKKALDAVKTDAQLTAEETEPPTEAPTEPETEAPTEEPTEAPTTPPAEEDTTPPRETIAVEGTAGQETDPTSNGGCGSLLSVAGAVLIPLCSAWVFCKRRR